MMRLTHSFTSVVDSSCRCRHRRRRRGQEESDSKNEDTRRYNLASVALIERHNCNTGLTHSHIYSHRNYSQWIVTDLFQNKQQKKCFN